MPAERRQFRILYRDFLLRIVDLELLSAHGEIQKLLVQFAAMLAAFSFTFSVMFVPRYGLSGLPRQRLMVLAWGDEEFLIATTMAIAGLFAVLAWNAFLPDRRDCIVLGLLPVRVRTIAFAKVGAIAAALGIGVVAINAFTGICYPFIVAPPEAGAIGFLRALAAYWLAMAAAGLFVCAALLAVEGLLSQLLSHRLFLRLSSWVQMAAFFLVLGWYFLKPPFPRAAPWMPSAWFFGLFQRLNGVPDPVFGRLAARALWSLAIVLPVAAATFALAYHRNLRRIVEQPDIVPADRSRPGTRIGRFLAATLLPKPIERAIVLFAARTIARSRQHRLLLAAYAGIGLAIALVYAKDVLWGRAKARWDQPDVPLLIATLVLLCFAVLGARAVFSLPLELRANWVFQITAVHSPEAYFTAVRKSLFALTAIPVWIVSALLCFTIWPVRAAFQHMAVLLAMGVLLVEVALRRFCKLPFACSYLPGKANLNVKLGIYAILFLIAADRGVAIESWAIERVGRFLVFFALLAIAAGWARRSTSAFIASPYNQIQFDDVAPKEISPLELH